MARSNLVGQTIFGYTVEETLGSGTFGTVYKVVKSNAAGQYVRALKHITIPTDKQYTSVLNSMGGDATKADNYFSEMFKSIVTEIQVLNGLSEQGTQHIVRYFENDIVETPSPRRYDAYILMEYLVPFDEYFQSRNDMTVRDVVRLGLEVLDGLYVCHNNNIIHRDIKDENIFVSGDGKYKIGDFGVSKILGDSAKAGSMKGTPNFIAPEVYLGKESYTQSVDLYSLGIVLYRLLNHSRNPFLPHFPEQYFSQDEDIAFEKRMRGDTPSLPSLGGELIGNVIIKAIANSKNRYNNAEDFIEALKHATQETPDTILEQCVSMGAFSLPQSEKNSNQAGYDATVSIMPQSHDDLVAKQDSLNATVGILPQSHDELAAKQATLNATVGILPQSHDELAAKQEALNATVGILPQSFEEIAADEKELDTPPVTATLRDNAREETKKSEQNSRDGKQPYKKKSLIPESTPTEDAKPHLSNGGKVPSEKQKVATPKESRNTASVTTQQTAKTMATPVKYSDKTPKIALLPLAILLIGVIAFYFIVPRVYGMSMSIIDWLFGPISYIHDAPSPEVMRWIWYIWIAALAASFFFVARLWPKDNDTSHDISATSQQK